MSAEASGAAPQGALKSAPPGRLKRSRASLFGGIATGFGAFALTLLLAGTSAGAVALAMATGAALGAWVRLADL
jgi:hypothetical protein